MIALGIDPGTAITGYAVMKIDRRGKEKPSLIDTGVIVTSSKSEMHKRLKKLHKELNIISRVHLPELMIVERLFFNTNAKTAISVGQARGISLLVAASRGMEVEEYTALEAKKIITGYGRAKKREVQTAVKEYLGLDELIKPDDATDAVAMVICHYQKMFSVK